MSVLFLSPCLIRKRMNNTYFHTNTKQNKTEKTRLFVYVSIYFLSITRNSVCTIYRMENMLKENTVLLRIHVQSRGKLYFTCFCFCVHNTEITREDNNGSGTEKKKEESIIWRSLEEEEEICDQALLEAGKFFPYYVYRQTGIARGWYVKVKKKMENEKFRKGSMTEYFRFLWLR